MRRIDWDENEHPRNVLGRFVKKLQGSTTGEKFHTQDEAARVQVLPSKEAGLKGPNRKVYQVNLHYQVDLPGKGKRTFETAEEAAKASLEHSAQQEGKDTIGPGSRAYGSLKEAEAAADASGPGSSGGDETKKPGSAQDEQAEGGPKGWTKRDAMALYQAKQMEKSRTPSSAQRGAANRRELEAKKAALEKAEKGETPKTNVVSKNSGVTDRVNRIKADIAAQKFADGSLGGGIFGAIKKLRQDGFKAEADQLEIQAKQARKRTDSAPVKVKITEAQLFEASGSEIISPLHDEDPEHSGYHASISKALRKVGSKGGTVTLSAEAAEDWAEFLDAMADARANSDLPQTAPAFTNAAEKIRAAAREARVEAAGASPKRGAWRVPDSRPDGLYIKKLDNGQFEHIVVKNGMVEAKHTSSDRKPYAQDVGRGHGIRFYASKPSATVHSGGVLKAQDASPKPTTPPSTGKRTAGLSMPLGAGPSTHTGWLGRYRKMGKDDLLAEREAYLKAREADPISGRDVRLSALNSAIAEASGEKTIKTRPGAAKPKTGGGKDPARSVGTLQFDAKLNKYVLRLDDDDAKFLIELHQSQNPARKLKANEEDALIRMGLAKRETIQGMGGTFRGLSITPEGQKLIGRSAQTWKQEKKGSILVHRLEGSEYHVEASGGKTLSGYGAGGRQRLTGTPRSFTVYKGDKRIQGAPSLADAKAIAERRAAADAGAPKRGLPDDKREPGLHVRKVGKNWLHEVVDRDGRVVAKRVSPTRYSYKKRRPDGRVTFHTKDPGGSGVSSEAPSSRKRNQEEEDARQKKQREEALGGTKPYVSRADNDRLTYEERRKYTRSEIERLEKAKEGASIEKQRVLNTDIRYAQADLYRLSGRHAVDPEPAKAPAKAPKAAKVPAVTPASLASVIKAETGLGMSKAVKGGKVAFATHTSEGIETKTADNGDVTIRYQASTGSVYRDDAAMKARKARADAKFDAIEAALKARGLKVERVSSRMGYGEDLLVRKAPNVPDVDAEIAKVDERIKDAENDARYAKSQTEYARKQYLSANAGPYARKEYVKAQDREGTALQKLSRLRKERAALEDERAKRKGRKS